MAEMLELTELLDRKPAQLSGGQRQRVAMGRALIREPVAFLLDEPLSNLDAKLRAELRAELKRLHARLETTMIFVTHDQVEAMTLGDRIAVMDRGRLQQVGTPEEIYRTPRNIFVARFVGSPAMNLLPGPAVGEADGVVVGIRPELLRPAAEAPGGITLDVLAEVVEPLGSDVFVHGVTGGGDAVVARLAGDARLSPGERVALSAPAGRGAPVRRGDASGERRSTGSGTWHGVTLTGLAPAGLPAASSAARRPVEAPGARQLGVGGARSERGAQGVGPAGAAVERDDEAGQERVAASDRVRARGARPALEPRPVRRHQHRARPRRGSRSAAPPVRPCSRGGRGERPGVRRVDAGGVRRPRPRSA